MKLYFTCVEDPIAVRKPTPHTLAPGPVTGAGQGSQGAFHSSNDTDNVSTNSGCLYSDNDQGDSEDLSDTDNEEEWAETALQYTTV